MRIKAKVNFLDFARDGLEHPNLGPGAEYFVLEVDDENYRVVNHNGEPILYPKELFEVLDRTVPAGWGFYEYDEGSYYLEPTFAAKPGFYEDWHGSDGDLIAQEANRQTLRDELARMAADSDSPEDKRLIAEALARLPP